MRDDEPSNQDFCGRWEGVGGEPIVARVSDCTIVKGPMQEWFRYGVSHACVGVCHERWRDITDIHEEDNKIDVLW